MVAVAFARVGRRMALALLREQRRYSAVQREMAVESPHLIWVNLPVRTLPAKLRAAVWAGSDGRCSYCGRELTPRTFTVDHVRPRARGGADGFDNLTVACRSCNSRKGSAWDGSSD